MKSDVFSAASQDQEMMIDVPEIDQQDDDDVNFNEEGNMLNTYGDGAMDTLGSSRRSSVNSRRTSSV